MNNNKVLAEWISASNRPCFVLNYTKKKGIYRRSLSRSSMCISTCIPLLDVLVLYLESNHFICDIETVYKINWKNRLASLLFVLHYKMYLLLNYHHKYFAVMDDFS